MNLDSKIAKEQELRTRVQTLENMRFGWPVFTVGRILLALALILIPMLFVQIVLSEVFTLLGIDLTSIWIGLFGGLIGTLAIIGGYAAYVRWIEVRSLSEFDRQHAGREFIGGALIGAAMFTVAVGVVWLAGGYQITGMNPWMIIVPAITGALFWATLEELVYRGALLRIAERRLGTWIALGISSLAFAGFHVVATPNATLWTGVSVFIAGLWLGGAYLYTRRLWFPIALHAAWNFTQGAVFGIAVSGDEAGQGLLIGITSGPTWLTGGAYGLEGSVVVVGIVLLAAILVLQQARKQGQFLTAFKRA
ncbi:type II CAAX prenyl endopeptidase Rce1 family protein [Halobium palmae]|uniref:Type II CAAX prenyl endopeptidase Rce1 family protein n=1 Tax=Halobium palmae TaxID=1776492 RepID=A0ABD5RWZ8_9EURY